MKIHFSFVFFTIILLTAFPTFPQNGDSLIIRDSLITSSAMPEFFPDKNTDYKILETIPDSTIDYKIMESKPGQYAVPFRQYIMPDSLLKKYDLKKRNKKQDQ